MRCNGISSGFLIMHMGLGQGRVLKYHANLDISHGPNLCGGIAGILYIFRKIGMPLNFQCLRSVRYNRADKIRAMEYSALRMSCLEVCMAGCWWVDVEIPSRFKTLILFFFQTVNMFWIPFEP